MNMIRTLIAVYKRNNFQYLQFVSVFSRYVSLELIADDIKCMISKNSGKIVNRLCVKFFNCTRENLLISFDRKCILIYFVTQCRRFRCFIDHQGVFVYIMHQEKQRVD